MYSLQAILEELPNEDQSRIVHQAETEGRRVEEVIAEAADADLRNDAQLRAEASGYHFVSESDFSAGTLITWLKTRHQEN